MREEKEPSHHERKRDVRREVPAASSREPGCASSYQERKRGADHRHSKLGKRARRQIKHMAERQRISARIAAEGGGDVSFDGNVPGHPKGKRPGCEHDDSKTGERNLRCVEQYFSSLLPAALRLCQRRSNQNRERRICGHRVVLLGRRKAKEENHQRRPYY